MKNVKIIFVDIDGTLTNSKEQVTEYTKNIIKKVTEKGIYVVLCSGRKNSYVIDRSLQASASKYVISNNGSLIYDYEAKKIIYEAIIDNNIAKEMFDYMDNLKDIGIAINCMDKTGQDKRYINKSEMKYTDCTNAITIDSSEKIKDDIIQFIIESENLNHMIEIEKISKKNNLQFYNQAIEYKNRIPNEVYWSDINKVNTGKGVAILNLLKALNIDKSQTMCFGDSLNDKEMFEICEYKIAMENAIDEIKNISTYITFSNDEDGVAKFLEKNIL